MEAQDAPLAIRFCAKCRDVITCSCGGDVLAEVEGRAQYQHLLDDSGEFLDQGEWVVEVGFQTLEVKPRQNQEIPVIVTIRKKS